MAYVDIDLLEKTLATYQPGVHMVYRQRLTILEPPYLSLEKMKFIRIVFFSLALSPALAQPSTEVYIFDLQKTKGSYEVAIPVNVSSNPGRYDNQPSFSEDSKTLYYVSQDTAGQTDIMTFDISAAAKTNFTKTASSEYSPMPTPDGKYISCIRVVGEEQLLWQFPVAGGQPKVVVPDLVIGYHAWHDKNTIVSFVLGEPQTLQINNLTTKTNKTVASNAGRSIHKIPGSQRISFLQNREGQAALIQSLDVTAGSIETITEALQNSQDMAWMPDGSIVMGQGNKLFVRPEGAGAWVEIANLQDTFQLQGITRLAVNCAGNKIAVVLNE